MIPISITLSHYKRKEIQEEMIYSAKNAEVVARFNDKFGSRPDILSYPKDILELAKQRATSFHVSEELWQNPLMLKPELRKAELDSLRIGWDLVLDIDCGFFEYSKLAADLVIKALKYNGVKSVSCKFSGNKGFHIGVPFESFPESITNKKTHELFPEAARRIAFLIKEMIKKPLGQKIMQLEGNDFSKVVKKTNENPEKIKYFEKNEFDDLIPRLNSEPFLVIDTILISSRHLYRMPYSLHEKSGLASLPIDPDKVLQFKKEYADPKNLKVSDFRFLNRKNIVKGEANQLFVQAFDLTIPQEEIKLESKKEYQAPETAIKQELFPPCIRLLLNGLEDGRKRAIFILLNFLTSAGWDYDSIEKLLKEWNKKNKEQLREVYLVGQLRHHKQNRKKIPPPNCNNQMYMVDIRVCKPDNLCGKIKNPITYAIRKGYYLNKNPKKEKPKKAKKNSK